MTRFSSPSQASKRRSRHRRACANAYSLAADLIPGREAPEIQSSRLRALARAAFRAR